MVYAVERLKQRVQEEKLDVFCVPTSFQSQELIVEGRLQITDLDRHPRIHVTVDGADEVDENLNLIKGN